MTELEQKLRRSAAEVEYPPTPPISEVVTRRLQEEGVTRPARLTRRPPTLRVALVATAILLLLASGVVAAVPTARQALLDLVGFRGATIERVPSLPDDVEVRLGAGLGEPTTLNSARPLLAFGPLLPTNLGEPNGVFLALDDVPGGELSLTYAPRPGLPRSRYTGVGLLLNEINGNFAPGFFGKLVPRGVRIERLRVDGHYAIWIEGLHKFFFKDATTHTYRIGYTRLAGNTLLVQRGPVMVRLEGEFDLDGAIAIAQSLRPATDASAEAD
jgi:hypothetical protein